MRRIFGFRRGGDDRGQAIAEFAIAFPLQLFVTLGIIQLGIIYCSKQVVEYAAFAAARAEVVGEDGGRAAQIVCSPITGGTPPAAPWEAVEVDVPGWGRLPDSDLAAAKTHVDVVNPAGDGDGVVRVTVTHDLELVVPFIGQLIDAVVGMTGGGRYAVFAGESVSARYAGGAPHVAIPHTVELACPWETEPAPDEVHEIPPGL
jgi:hypothetical protein